jgi:hypothetical protein
MSTVIQDSIDVTSDALALKNGAGDGRIQDQADECVVAKVMVRPSMFYI